MRRLFLVDTLLLARTAVIGALKITRKVATALITIDRRLGDRVELELGIDELEDGVRALEAGQP